MYILGGFWVNKFYPTNDLLKLNALSANACKNAIYFLNGSTITA
jgi:hypothetical protein